MVGGMRLNKASRLAHRWATVVVAVPLLIMVVTGVMLQWKKEATWVQPATQRGVGTVPTVGFDNVLASVVAVEEAGIASWDDVDRLDVRPGKGVIKVRSKTRWEVQVDAETGEVLQAAYRRSDLIESLHDGSFFHDTVKMWVFFPAALALLLMLVTGIWLFALPYVSKKKRRARGRAAVAAAAERAADRS